MRWPVVWICAMTFVATPVMAQADEQPNQLAAEGDFVFKPIAIEPSPHGEFYTGRFLFVNKKPTPVMVSGFDEPIDGKFEPRFLQYQILENGVWKEKKVWYCGTGAQDFAMQPGKSYEFHTDLTTFEEQDTPLTGKIGFSVHNGDQGGWTEYWSKPFVLDWKKDRANGVFAAAREKHDKTVRAVFSKAGFKDDVLVGEEFCSRLLQSMINPTAAQQTATAFKPLLGKLETIPDLELDGKIRIDFSSDEKQNHESRYSGTFILDPKKFNPTWFRQAAKRHATAYKGGDDIFMQLDDGTGLDSPLYLSIEYHSFANEKRPTVEDSKTRFQHILEVLVGCLKE